MTPDEISFHIAAIESVIICGGALGLVVKPSFVFFYMASSMVLTLWFG